ncbi:MAG: transcriptional regulator [Candidatus Thiodiazotropha endolucinida]|nr:transcriptional regulator [Candidatus Thiodiazotropha taylori]MCG8096404.1 transcriptional regulator [Candidatus Thiodiazotropha endolucinida]MCG8048011.1 transcriptional regulator [Candidatus Thiodiazotropha taylori]MCG8063785.1 transcriptional regulator [Candidatus Thiodiazotropha taylori]MCG8072808.1 transcriptional regulator [Candidatus Thiodiazotropha taylori]
MQPTSIGDALFTKTQQRVLSLLYGTPDKSFYANEIVRWADMGRGTVRRELERMTAAGLLVSSRTGNQLHYQANADNPIYPDLLNIVRKTFGVADVIRQALRSQEAHIDVAFVYGSIAKLEDSQTSDLDLMLVGDLTYSDIVELLLPVESSLQRTINPTIYTLSEFNSRLQQGSSFLERVMKQPKLMIKGVINDFGEPLQEQGVTKGTTR